MEISSPRAFPRILIAAAPASVQELVSAVADGADPVVAQSFEEAAQALHLVQPDLILVGYYFDDSQPYRFIKFVRSDSRYRRTPILLVRAIGLPLGTTSEADIRNAYATLGVTDFLNLHDEAAQIGAEAARRRLREAIDKALLEESTP